MKKNLILLLVVVALVALGAWYWSSSEEGSKLAEDSTAAISQDLDGVDLGDLESEFKDVQEALGTL
ncbi:MAG: hypothetical protein G01um101419_622 [Parcubacteria group bacterium Gr01-1014_19]|nr:MAG: hypothetical protein G01um101419_622 [Parcubacteria group bacterium Gr01-1014_19]